MKADWTEPRIYFGCKRVAGLPDHRQPKTLESKWFIYWRHLNPKTGQYERQRKFDEINRETTIEARFKLAKQVKEAIRELLVDGFNPYRTEQDPDSMPLLDAIAKALDIKSKSVRLATAKEYDRVVRLFNKAATDLGFNSLSISQLGKKHLRTILDHMTDSGMTDHSFNRVKLVLSALFEILIDYDIIETNPAQAIKQKRHTTTHYETLTIDERNRMRAHLERTHPDFLHALLCIFYLGIRRTELTKIKVGDVSEGFVRISESASKNKKLRTLPLVGEIRQIITDRIKDKSPGEFLFGFGCKVSPTPCRPDYLTKAWLRWVQNQLGIKAPLYGLKATGAQQRIKNGMSLEDVSKLFDHSSTAITDKHYTRESIAERASENLERFTTDF
jgi:hypothetical protein